MLAWALAFDVQFCGRLSADVIVQSRPIEVVGCDIAGRRISERLFKMPSDAVQRNVLLKRDGAAN